MDAVEVVIADVLISSFVQCLFNKIQNSISFGNLWTGFISSQKNT